MSMKFFGTPCLLIAFVLLTTAACRSKREKHTVDKKPETRKAVVKKESNKSGASSDNWISEMGLTSKDIRKNQLYSFVNEWYGVPYKYGGCKKSGVDCSCFTNLLYEQVYHKNINGNAAEIYRNAEKISLDKAREGDLLFFKIGVSYVSHVGVLLRGKHFVHASTSKGVMVSRIDEAYYKKYFHSAGRIKP